MSALRRTSDNAVTLGKVRDGPRRCTGGCGQRSGIVGGLAALFARPSGSDFLMNLPCLPIISSPQARGVITDTRAAKPLAPARVSVVIRKLRPDERANSGGNVGKMR